MLPNKSINMDGSSVRLSMIDRKIDLIDQIEVDQTKNEKDRFRKVFLSVKST